MFSTHPTPHLGPEELNVCDATVNRNIHKGFEALGANGEELKVRELGHQEAESIGLEEVAHEGGVDGRGPRGRRNVRVRHFLP